MTRNKSSGFVVESFGVNTFEVWSNVCVVFNHKKEKTCAYTLRLSNTTVA